MVLCSKVNEVFAAYLDPINLSVYCKNNSYDLTDRSAKTKTLAVSDVNLADNAVL